jgi:hypothetical protein
MTWAMTGANVLMFQETEFQITEMFSTENYNV